MALANNRNLEELFDLPQDQDLDHTQTIDSEPSNDIENNLPVLPAALENLDKIESALPAVKGLEASDSEMDDLAAKASESFDDLMNLGMQVDSRYASEIFAVAGTMLGHAITAKTAKINKKLKMIQLQMQKAKLDQSQDKDSTDIPTAQGRVLNRNDLLRTIMEQDHENAAKGK